MTTKYSIKLGLASAALALALTSGIAFADTNNNSERKTDKAILHFTAKSQVDGQMKKILKPLVSGKVTAIGGTTLTVVDNHDNITYTVNASGAIVTKMGTPNATTTLSSVLVNDNVFVEGTITGTNITATRIYDGQLKVKNAEPMHPPVIKGDGQPVVAGVVSGVTGTTLTLTNSGVATYTVDAGSAMIVKKGVASSTVSSISAGDYVLVQGTINGTSIKASSVTDVALKVSTTTPPKGPKGFFGKIGSFFGHFFRF
jgi:hypothetical protein